MVRGSAAVFCLVLVLVLGCLVAPVGLWARSDEPRAGETVGQYLTPALLDAIFPAADKVGPVAGTPPAAPVYQAGRQVGWLFSTWDVTQSKGFSGRPLVLLVGIDLAGHIAGARLVHHSEPIVFLGLPEAKIEQLPEHFKGHDLRDGIDVVIEVNSAALGHRSFSQRPTPGPTAAVQVDAISRATTSSVLMSDAIVRGARIVARSRGVLPALDTRAARLDVDRFAPADWSALEAAGAIAHLHLTYGEVRSRLAGQGASRIEGDDPAAASADPFLDLYVALLTPAGIGVNILGKTWYDQYTAGRGIDDQIILIAANCGTSLLGPDRRHGDTIGPIGLTQGETTIRLSARQIKALPFLHAKGAPALSERALAFFRGGSALDPARPWQARLLVAGETADGQRRFASFELPYKLPDAYILKARAVSAGGAPVSDHALAWRAIWRAHLVRIAILAVGLSALTVILFLQDTISRRPRLHRWVRIGFLSWTLIWLGWYAGAQLTIVDLITWLHTLVTDFRWDYVLADPLVTLLALFTLAGLFVWGRGAFCGWLCPFGALQELANTAARRLGIHQIGIPIVLHRRLAAAKYVLFLGLVAVSFVSWDLAMKGAEIEPFKTAIVFRFMAAWPMVAYALALVAASLFVERFYCRFACPLGGGLAVFGRVRLFNWLKRHDECGSRCRLCENVCPVGAIRRSGAIDMNECFYCLDCQVTYHDDHICPPMVWRRKRLAVLEAAGEGRR